jgi:hypothetical protein
MEVNIKTTGFCAATTCILTVPSESWYVPTACHGITSPNKVPLCSRALQANVVECLPMLGFLNVIYRKMLEILDSIIL